MIGAELAQPGTGLLDLREGPNGSIPTHSARAFESVAGGALAPVLAETAHSFSSDLTIPI
jgi:hypothetical protein